ncbi:MAG: type II/IV secretion system protein, partial [Synechococcaceae bacterium WB8_1A_041]|nr:type II/IV secretion system protein [Synechococcaceae bacterium WB8_1A_041]
MEFIHVAGSPTHESRSGNPAILKPIVWFAVEKFELSESAASGNASPMVQLADRILLQALDSQASDIHIEPQETGLRVRLRIDGVLQNAFDPLPAELIPALT